MSILSGWIGEKLYKKTADGYRLTSRDTSSQTVYFSDGKTAQEKLGEINGISSNLNITDSDIAASIKSVNNLKNTLNASIKTNVDLLRQSFQDGCKKLADKLAAKGISVDGNNLDSILNGIDSMNTGIKFTNLHFSGHASRGSGGANGTAIGRLTIPCSDFKQVIISGYSTYNSVTSNGHRPGFSFYANINSGGTKNLGNGTFDISDCTSVYIGYSDYSFDKDSDDMNAGEVGRMNSSMSIESIEFK